MKRLALVAFLAVAAPAQAVLIIVDDPVVLNDQNITVANGNVWTAA